MQPRTPPTVVTNASGVYVKLPHELLPLALLIVDGLALGARSIEALENLARVARRAPTRHRRP